MDGIDDILDPLLAAFSAKLEAELVGQLTEIYLAGSAQMVSWGKTLGGKPIVFEGPPIQQAVGYAEKHCATLVKGLDNETKERLAKVISDGISDKRGVDGLARDIRREFTDMSRYRSQLIARTESCDALEQAFMDRAKDLGVTGKEVIGGDPCEICQANIAEGAVPIDHVFSSGHTRPPFHPSCRCGLAPVML